MYPTTAHVSCKPHSQPRKTHTTLNQKKSEHDILYTKRTVETSLACGSDYVLESN